jgi:hypothetical protein
LQTAEARGREEGCGGRRRKISQSRSSSSSGGADGNLWRRLAISPYSLNYLSSVLIPHSVTDVDW